MRALTWKAGLAVAVSAFLAGACSSGASPSGMTPAGANHRVHLQGAIVAVPLTCDACHSATGFAVDFSQNPTLRAAGARFDPGTKTCSNVACHGNFTFGTVSGKRATPRWDDTTPTTCASCHDMPPTGHPAAAGATTAASCSGCHPTSVDAAGVVIVGGAHMNMRADVAGLGCTTCHGDATRVGILAGTDPNLVSAPPVETTGAPSAVVGAHLGHVNPAAASALMGPVGCAECHVVPGDSAHATASTPRAQRVVFGPLAKTGGVAPTYDATSLGCAATYCHGNFTLGAVRGAIATALWTDTWPTTEARCVSCHGMPPTGHPVYAGSQAAASCFQCHPQSVNSDGTIKTAGGHLNGRSDGGGCTACHDDPPTTGKHTISDHRTLRCDKCHPTGYTSTTTVPALHDNGRTDLGSQAGYRCNDTASLVGCSIGESRTCINSCHGRETW